MDRELVLIQSVSDLVKIVDGIQESIKNLTGCVELLKDRIEKLEQE